MHFSIPIHEVFVGSPMVWAQLQAAYKYRLMRWSLTSDPVCLLLFKIKYRYLKRLKEKPLKQQNVGMLASLALIIPCFNQKNTNTYFKTSTDSWYAKHRLAQWSNHLKSATRIQYVPSVSHRKAWLEFTVWLQKPFSDRNPAPFKVFFLSICPKMLCSSGHPYNNFPGFALLALNSYRSLV